MFEHTNRAIVDTPLSNIILSFITKCGCKGNEK